MGKIAGIETQVHASFLLILAWAAWQGWRVQPSGLAMAVSVAFVLLMFGCVLLHELGHALMARRFGVGTRSITLLPIGGVASLEGMPKNARQELLVAVAGPAVNLVIAAGLFLGLTLTGGFVSAELAASSVLGFVLMFAEGLMWANLALAAFNMLPAFPMDGGRVLRAALAMRGDRLGATERAVKVGKVLAVGLGVYGLFVSNNPFLLLIAAFVWMTGNQELAAVRREAQLEELMRRAAVDEYTLQKMRHWIQSGHGVVLHLPDGRRVQI